MSVEGVIPIRLPLISVLWYNASLSKEVINDGKLRSVLCIKCIFELIF